MGKMATHQLASASSSRSSSSGPAPASSAASSAASSSSSSAGRGVPRARGKLPAATASASHAHSSPVLKAHHPQYKADVGRFVYYFLREQQHQGGPQSTSAPQTSLSGHSSPPRPTASPKPTGREHRAMPRRKSTKKIIIDPSPRDADDGKEPHTVFRSNGSPIISPRLIRNSLLEPSRFELEDDDDPNASAAGMLAVSPQKLAARGEDAMVAAQAARELELAKNLEAEKAMTGLSGVQLWVHRLLVAHNNTLATLGIDRKDFPNSRLSLKQFEQVLTPVVSLCNMMRADHFGIHVPTPQIARTMNDVHYWKLWESDTIDIGIFFMPPNSVIPLHNHPGMSVVTRVLYGTAKVTSFDLISEPEGAEEPQESAEITKNDKSNVHWARVSRQEEVGTESTLWLDPRRFNLHEIRANDSLGCAMLDVMVPPYDNANRDCHHFKILVEKLMGDQRIVKMLESIMPDNHNAPPSENSTASSSPASS